MDIIGLDIGTSLIKGVAVRKEKGTCELLNYAFSPAFKESLLSESATDADKLSESLRKFISESSFSSTNVVASFPETHVFTRVIEIPKMSRKEVEKAVFWEAEQYLPISIEDVTLNFQILPKDIEGESSDKTEVLLVAVPKGLVQRFVKILIKAGLTPVGLEPESMSIARSIYYNESSYPVTLVVNIGSEVTNLSILVDDYIRFTRSISTGGSSISRAISQELNLEAKQAQEYLKSYGLDESKMDGKIKASIEPVFNVILNEIRKSVAFYETRKNPRRVKRVVLCGGTSTVPGILVHTAQYLNLEVQKADPWKKLVVASKFNEKELDDLGPMFATGVGLVLKDI
ncbi:MAG: type IV pilus assembly protein PilM [Patescibacteria group bacterium]|nr:type IV pilus assembly protein PilM [Patescibacteria group bacterium]